MYHTIGKQKKGRGGGKSPERGIEGGGGESRERSLLLFSVIIIPLFILVQLKHQKFGALLSPIGEGRQGQPPSLAPLSCVLGLIYQL